ncbi:hypothetical protein L596_021937 [Steinernema carpocapsae]|uniref:Uncharacterized protein n=1 Tax=Steinernema carpocapsae TaxID=34508 RepID=A0A4U5MK83_STECR|nr:hypothetical protein L596_021937 [Steinernema carpocapsae]
MSKIISNNRGTFPLFCCCAAPPERQTEARSGTSTDSSSCSSINSAACSFRCQFRCLSSSSLLLDERAVAEGRCDLLQLKIV